MREIHRLQILKGWSLHTRDGEIGAFRQVYFDDREWQGRYIVVRTGSWLLDRSVLVAPRAVVEVDSEQQRITVDLTRAQIEASPPLDTERPVSRHYEEVYHRFYGWAPYWSGPGLGGLPMAVPPLSDGKKPSREPARPHLRSSDEVAGYDVLTRNGRLGHVEDLLVDDENWKICYAEVDTRNWWPGKKVLVAPTWIDEIRWAEREISVKLRREVIREAPEYDPTAMITPDFEVELFEYYARAAADTSQRKEEPCRKKLPDHPSS